MRLFTLLISVLLFLGCKEDNPEQNKTLDSDDLEVQAPSKVTKKDIENIDYAEYGLSNASIKNVSNWASYGELESQILALKNGELAFLEGDEKVIAALVKDLKGTMPKTVESPSIQARILALETKLYKLRSAVLISQTTKEQLLLAMKELFISFSNLNLQMNKKFEKEAQDISRSSF